MLHIKKKGGYHNVHVKPRVFVGVIFCNRRDFSRVLMDRIIMSWAHLYTTQNWENGGGEGPQYDS